MLTFFKINSEPLSSHFYICIFFFLSCGGTFTAQIKRDRDSIAKIIDRQMDDLNFKEAKTLYTENFDLFKMEEMAHLILYDLNNRVGDQNSLDSLERIILSDDNDRVFDKMVISFLSGDVDAGKGYLSLCKKQLRPTDMQKTMINFFSEIESNGEFVSVQPKLEWRLSGE